MWTTLRDLIASLQALQPTLMETITLLREQNGLLRESLMAQGRIPSTPAPPSRRLPFLRQPSPKRQYTDLDVSWPMMERARERSLRAQTAPTPSPNTPPPPEPNPDDGA